MRDRGMLDNRYVLVNGSFANLNIDGLLTIDGAVDNNIFRLGEVALDLDFTGTDYDTQAELDAIGLWLGSTTTPFPTTLVSAVGGNFAHSAGNGWYNNTSTPGMVMRVDRDCDFELELVIDYSQAAGVADVGALHFGFLTGDNHVGAYASIVDVNAGATEIEAYLNTNDGDDTYTAQFSGAAEAGADDMIYRFTVRHGCVGVYDFEDTADHWYEGRGAAGYAYTPAYVFLQGAQPIGQLWTLYIKSLTLTYLL